MMKRIRRFALAVAIMVAVLAGGAAQAQSIFDPNVTGLPAATQVVTIHDNGGGSVRVFLDQIKDYRLNRSSVRIMGECASACTMLLSLKEHVCVGPDAKLEFHQAFFLDPRNPSDTSDRSAMGTAILWMHYPRPIQKWIAAHGGLTAHLITLQGAELHKLMPACREPTVSL